MAASEERGLVSGTISSNLAASMTLRIVMVIGTVQLVLMVILMSKFDYGPLDGYKEQYIVYRDIMVMLLLGFGYLMSFLEKYGLGAVGFTMLLTALNMECNIVIENVLTGNYEITMESIINAEFSAATLLISFGALIGRATPLQMCVISILEALFYAVNKVIIVFGSIKPEDVGGTITIHMFGAYFGLACAGVLGRQGKESASNNSSSKVSDVFSLVGTTLLWVYWPSFVGATETAHPENEMRCLINTILSLIGSTGATFFWSQYLNGGKFDAVHIQNSTLAGGVAIGSTGRLAMGPGMALLVGLLAGIVSVLGYQYSSPFLEKQFGLFDTCGVGNLHGYPSILGGLLSIILVYTNSDADFLEHEVGTQSLMQFVAVAATLIVAYFTGYISTLLTKPCCGFVAMYAETIDYDDAIWWHGVE